MSEDDLRQRLVYFEQAVGDQTAAGLLGYPAAGATTGYGGSNFYENYSSADWSASLVPVAETGSLAPLGTGVLGVAGMARRKFCHI